MNFKITSFKTAISIVLGIVISLFFSYTIYTLTDIGPMFRFGTGSIAGFFIGLIVTYLIWSLIQKKK